MYKKTADDLRIEYSDTIVSYRKVAHQIGDVEFKGGKPYFKMVNLENSKIATVSIDDEDLILKFPSTGWFNFSDGFSLYINRLDKRQWRRTLCNSNVYISEHFSEERAYVRAPSITDGKKLIPYALYSEIFNPKYFQWEEAVESLRSGERVAAAINNNILIGYKKIFRHPILFYNQHAVAEVVNKSVKITEHNLALRESLDDNGIKYHEAI